MVKIKHAAIMVAMFLVIAYCFLGSGWMPGVSLGMSCLVIGIEIGGRYGNK